MKLNRRRRHLPISITLSTFAATGFGLIFGGTLAWGHDDVVSTSPSAGEVVEAGIIEVQLQYSGELMAVAQSAEIVVLNSDGELENNGCAVIDGSTAYTSIDLDLPGVHSVSWRVVSEDGHPIEGTFEFEVTNSSGHVSSGLVPGTECDWAISELPNGEVGEGDDLPGWLYWLLWLLIPAGGVGLYFWLRPRASK